MREKVEKEAQINKLYSFPFGTKAFVIRYPLNLIRQALFAHPV